MIKQRGVLGVLAGGAAFVLSGCGLIWPSDRLRHKIIVEVETPQGLRTGSSVIETEVRKGKSWGDASGTSFYIKGEAVAVDLLGGRTLFALLRGADGVQGDAAGYQTGLMSQALNAGAPANVTVNVKDMPWMEARALIKDAEVKLDLPRAFYPMLVTFTDIADPKSVLKVEPGDLGARFGAGVKLRRITVEVTDEAVTTGIGERLPDTFWQAWGIIHKQEMTQEGGIMKNPYFDSLAGHLSKNDFVSGVR